MSYAITSKLEESVIRPTVHLQHRIQKKIIAYKKYIDKILNKKEKN